MADVVADEDDEKDEDEDGRKIGDSAGIWFGDKSAASLR